MFDTNKVIQEIAQFSNTYNYKKSLVLDKLIAMWEIGNILITLNDVKPHSLGWDIQEKTGGIIKRPLIFRSYKIRKIWDNKEDLISECKSIKNLSNITEMLPLIDPEQKVKRKNIPESVISNLRDKMVSLDAKSFKALLKKTKDEYKDDRMGQKNIRNKNHPELYPMVNHFNNVSKYFISLIEENKQNERRKMRTEISTEELKTFSEICSLIATHKNNFKNEIIIDKKLSTSSNNDFKLFYDFSMNILISNKQKRDRFGSVAKYKIPYSIPEISDIASSLVDEESVRKYHERKKFEIKI